MDDIVVNVYVHFKKAEEVIRRIRKHYTDLIYRIDVVENDGMVVISANDDDIDYLLECFTDEELADNIV